jgi:hypothetical protein
MAKQHSPRTNKPSNRAAREFRNTPIVSSDREQTPLATVRKQPPLTTVVSHEAIAARAYALFLARGGQPGDASHDWFQAEAELRQEMERGGESRQE